MAVDTVDYFTNRQAVDTREEKAAYKVDRVRDDRYFIFFFDKPEDNALFSDLTRARMAVSNCIGRPKRGTIPACSRLSGVSAVAQRSARIRLPVSAAN